MNSSARTGVLEAEVGVYFRSMKTQRGRETFRSEEARWQAVLARDERADAHFVYGVRTTGVYCRPSAASRRPRRENIEFFDSPTAAERAGYRPSRRPRGDRTSAERARAEIVALACQRIEAEGAVITLVKLAAEAGMSPFHFHRVFKAETGLTPKAYAAAARSKKLREELATGKGSVTTAIYGAGFGSSSRFYERSNAMLGMRARDYQAGGAGMTIRFAVGECSLGAVLVAQSAVGVCAISLGDDPERLVHELQERFQNAELVGGDREFERVVAEVIGFLEEPALGLRLPLDVRGTVFQERVWRALSEIPAGTTVSYTELAERIGAPTAARAVAQACGKNKIAVAIPCHRVVRRDGDLAGYRWGVERKRALLAREKPKPRQP